MKRAGAVRGAAVVVLCLFSLNLYAGDAHVFLIDSPAWKTNVNIAAPDGAVTMRRSNCPQGPAYDLSLPATASRAYFTFRDSQCNEPPTKKLYDPDFKEYDTGLRMWVVTLPVASGTPRVTSLASYRDGQHFNTVRIPSLPDALPAGSTSAYWFYGIESYPASKEDHVPFAKAAQIYLLADGAFARARVTVYDQDGAEIPAAGRILTVGGWEAVDLPLSTTTRTYNVRVESLWPNQFGMLPTGLYAIAASYDPRGGGPAIDVPARE